MDYLRMIDREPVWDVYSISLVVRGSAALGVDHLATEQRQQEFTD